MLVTVNSGSNAAHPWCPLAKLWIFTDIYKKTRTHRSIESATRDRLIADWAPEFPGCIHLVVQGAGFHPEASACLRKWVLVMKGTFRYCGSSTMVVTISQESPFGSTVRL